MESRESQRDKRIQDVIQGRPAGGGKSPTAAAMRAREEIQGIEAERAANLERQKVIGNTRQQQIATMKQAALLGASGMAAADGGARVSPVAQQAAAMNPQTQAILQKYGVKPGPRTTMSSTQQSGPNIRTTNTTTNNVRNEIRIVQPQIPMRQQQIPIGAQGKSGNLDKFKAWLDSSFAKQANEYEIQQKEYRRREWNLARNSSKLFQKLSESTKSLGEKMDPRNMGSTFGGQMKTLLFLFLATTINKWWNPLMKRLTSFEAGFKAVFGIPMNADLERNGAGGLSFVNKIKEFIGINTKTEKGKNTSLIEGIKNAFSDGVDRLIATLKLFIEDRRIALQKINMPDFKLPKTDFNPLGNMINSAFKGVMAPATEYLGNILSALLGGSNAVAKRAASNISSVSQEDFKKSYGGRYFTSNSTDWMGNLKNDSTYGMSMMMSHNLSERSNKLHTGNLMTGMKMLEGNAKRSGGAVINPDLLRQLGFGDNFILGMVQSGQAEYVPMKLVKVPKTEAEREDFSGGSVGSYIGNEILDDATFGIYGKLTGWSAKKMVPHHGARAGVRAKQLGLKGVGKVIHGAGKAVRAAGRWAGPLGWIATVGGGVAEGISDYMDANEGNSSFVYKAVPLTDERPGEQIRLLRITPEGFNSLKKAANIKSFDATDTAFQRWIEGVERSRKAMMNIKGKLSYSNKYMNVLNQANTISANYNAKKHRIWNDRNYTGRGDIGNIVAPRDNVAIAFANGMSWAANGLNDIKFRLTGKISPLHIPAGEARRNAERGIRYLMENYGLSKEAAAGIAGVIQKESGWNPGAQNLTEKGKGYKGFGRGLCQWSNNWGIKDFPEWYLKTHGERKYPDEVPLEHQLDYLMTGLAENGLRKEEFLRIIHKPGVTVEEAARAMFLGYENGGKHLASFSALASVKEYGGVAGVSKMYTDRASAALGFYNNVLGGGEFAGYNQTSSGEYSLDEDATDDDVQGLWKAEYVMSKGQNGQWDLSSLKLADPKDIEATLVGEEVTDSLKLGDWFVGRSIRYIVGNANKRSIKKCAMYVRLALKAGGINDSNHPAAATDYLHYLPKRGFARIREGQLQPGDICVLPAGGTHIYGHICMYTGKVWVSDYIQTSMIVYNKGNWPYVLFRYTGKGGSGTDTLIDESQNFIQDGLDATGKILGKGAEILAKTSDSINPETEQEGSGKMDVGSLNYAQRATYEWAKKFEEVKEDKTGLYIDDLNNGYRHYIDLNSGISETGLLTKNNIQGTYLLKNGRAFEPVNDTLESKVAQDSFLSTVAGRVSKLNSTGRVIDYTLPGTYGHVGCEGHWFDIRYNVYDIAGDGSGYYTLLVPTIPFLTEKGLPVRNEDGSLDYPTEYGYTGTPKEGWSIFYSKQLKIRSDISGTMKNYEYSPYLRDYLKINPPREVLILISSILSMIRGEEETLPGDLTDEEKEKLEILHKSAELRGKTKDITNEITNKGREILGINENTLNDALKVYNSGKEKDRFKDLGGNIIDTKTGVTILKNGESNINNILKMSGTELTNHVNTNLQTLSTYNGTKAATAEGSLERYKNLYDNDIFKIKKEGPYDRVGELKKALSGRIGNDPVSLNKYISGLAYSSISDDTKFETILREDGTLGFILKSNNDKDRTRLRQRFEKRDKENAEKLWQALNNPTTKIGDKEVTNGGLTLDQLEKLGIFLNVKNKDSYKEGIDWSNLESILKSGLLDRGTVEKYIAEISAKVGLRKGYINDRDVRRKWIEEYNKNSKKFLEEHKNFSIENGFLVQTDDGDRKTALGKVKKEGGSIEELSETDYVNTNLNYLNNPSEKAKEFNFRDRQSWYAYKFGAKPANSMGHMYIQFGKNKRVVFNINEVGDSASIDHIIKKGTFYEYTGSGKEDKNIFRDGNWRRRDEKYEKTYGQVGSSNLMTTVNENQERLSESKNDEKTLRDYVDNWGREENEELRKNSFTSIWKADELKKQLNAVYEGGEKETNAHLGNIADIESSQLKLLGIIAKNTAKMFGGEDVDNLVDEIVAGNRSINEEKRDRGLREHWYKNIRGLRYKVNKDGKPLSMEQSAKYFNDYKKVFMDANKLSEEDFKRITGVREWGGYTFGIMNEVQQPAATAQAKSKDAKKEAKEVEQLKAKEANTVKTRSETSEIEKKNAQTMKNVGDSMNKNAQKEADLLKKQEEYINNLINNQNNNDTAYLSPRGETNISNSGNTQVIHIHTNSNVNLGNGQA